MPASSDLPGMLSSLSPSHIRILLQFLKSARSSVMEFDFRPGLKFLVQKVGQLKSAANLYKEAGASWSLSTVCAFEIVVNIIRRDSTTPETVKELLEKHQRKSNTLSDTDNDGDEKKESSSSSPSDKEEEIDEYYFFLHLHDSFLEICETYVDIILDKDGQRAKTDELVRQPLYFFSFDADEDDFYDLTRGSEIEEIENDVFPPPSDVSKKGSSDKKKKGNNNKRGEGDSLDKTLEGEEEVLRVATQSDINSVLSEFRHRKGKQSLPSTSSIDGASSSVFKGRRNPFTSSSDSSETPSHGGGGDPEIAHQQKESLLRDSEAQIKVWTELVVVLLELSKELPDEEYKSLLPLLFPGVKALAAHAQDAILKQEVADVFVRVGSIFGFNAE
eukprot:TRINITY_DN4831_c0_g1_i1.p1 TRINITY_DN4831_c0_g1~~TRINITY_DN4831_c0_g1_i1.p1  ORF type:complete len:388 (-),score=140.18 TRINITY_DN4831_c0_g1_i1:1104-2267(-)